MQTPRSIVPRVIVIAAGVLTALMILLSSTASAAVALNYFSVIWDPAEGIEAIEITWETATEFDTSGFQVERAISPSGTYTIPEDVQFVPATGDQVTGETYGPFFNMDVITGTTYWYRLVVYDRSGNPDYGIPPVAVIAGNPNTPTPTNTPNTPTGGGIPPTATNTPTPTASATRTRTPTITSTPPPSSTPTRGPSPTRTLTVQLGSTVTPIGRATVANTPASQPIAATDIAAPPSVPSVNVSPTPVLITPTPESVAFNSSPLSTPDFISAEVVPTLVPTNASVVAVAPVVITTPTGPENAAPQGNRTVGLIALIGAAGLLLLGGLYIILRQTSK